MSDAPFTDAKPVPRVPPADAPATASPEEDAANARARQHWGEFVKQAAKEAAAEESK